MKLGLLGCGKMGSALVRGILHGGPPVESVAVFDPYAPAMDTLCQVDPRIQSHRSIAEATRHADVLFLCTKPDAVTSVAAEIATVSQPVLCISVAAGVSLATLEEPLGNHHRAIRVMPNTPALVGAGASAFTLGSRATPDDGQLARTLLQSVGLAHEVPESLLDAVTGLSGSGPAYIYLVIEALADGGVLHGLPRPIALELAAQTVLGAAKMVLETGLHPGVLKDQVTSPRGTTIRGVAALEAQGLRHALISAVDAATRRSQELGCPTPREPSR